MKKKSILIILAIIIITSIIIIFIKNEYKGKNLGNNISKSDTADILNISSYEATINVEVISNKTTNKYILKQQYINPNIETQEVLEPSNIAGTKIIKNGNNLKLENTKLKLQTIYENYKYLADNCLDLSDFISCYKESSKSIYEEKDGQIIMETKDLNGNKYTQNRKLYIDRKTGTPTKMEITDINKNVTVYIVYNEVKINSLNEGNILAFRLYNEKQNV